MNGKAEYRCPVCRFPMAMDAASESVDGDGNPKSGTRTWTHAGMDVAVHAGSTTDLGLIARHLHSEHEQTEAEKKYGYRKPKTDNSIQFVTAP